LIGRLALPCRYLAGAGTGVPAGLDRASRRLCLRQIEETDKEIDALVYELYGLTEKETAIVEEPP